MADNKDHHAQGQHDREDSRNDSFVDTLFHGGSSPHYNPPSNTDDRAAYNAGWQNGGRK